MYSPRPPQSPLNETGRINARYNIYRFKISNDGEERSESYKAYAIPSKFTDFKRTVRIGILPWGPLGGDRENSPRGGNFITLPGHPLWDAHTVEEVCGSGPGHDGWVPADPRGSPPTAITSATYSTNPRYTLCPRGSLWEMCPVNVWATSCAGGDFEECGNLKHKVRSLYQDGVSTQLVLSSKQSGKGCDCYHHVEVRHIQDS